MAAFLETLRRHRTGLLRTYLSDGTGGVDTPVSIVVDGDRVLFQTWEDSDKAERLSRNPMTELRPCTIGGRPTGPAARGEVRLLLGAKARDAAHLLQRRHPALHRWAVPLSYRLMHRRTLHYELRVVEEPGPGVIDRQRSDRGPPE
ncbi:PPOX class F420-dependent oxidoreductase [Nocardiopsis ansamitocini]|uniref:Pyridoxamine 5'-phosphate oxidase putative domain-containing protein n=1 Tax=Nocardiopsis ansamitocini TaxID=1670832 RepID=A0A9W6UKK5_9ACTN|nr:PPOX class F420-dependent oxidoreductase [Nocardiopsis ansamitocini]GLU49832.1 hypothetical protein Nans01_41830 [Nocardiopsis ansamitocini]